MDDRMHESGMKRRKFFGSLVGGGAMLIAGLPILRTLIRRTPRPEEKKVVVTVNPLAVPRGAKGGSHV
jgi:divalent metal cation (Fe/Co/Zn/Cd) transporter